MVDRANSPDSQPSDDPLHVRVSDRTPRYFELSDGTPFVPIGLNVASARETDEDTSEWARRMEHYVESIATNGGNFLRVWLSHPSTTIESAPGEFRTDHVERVDRLFEMAAEHGIRVKPCLEHGRWLTQPGDSSEIFRKPGYHVSEGGPVEDMTDFFLDPEARRSFREKLDFLAERYGDDPHVFAWELWNEINATEPHPSAWLDWTEEMLTALHERFPHNMAVQSLGSFDSALKRGFYRAVSRMPGNDFAQVHRYLDLGAELEVCRGPMDVLAADAVRELLCYDPGRPVVLAETGGVQPNHTGPIELYERDEAGALLHDGLFAPFFAGGAAPGQFWHWDAYVDANDLWHHFARFSEAISGVDPVAEGFRPRELDHPRLRVYALAGEDTSLLWCRDAENTWRNEFETDQAPKVLADVTIDVGGLPEGVESAAAYDPWTDEWTDLDGGERVNPPAFERSLVVRLEH